MSNLSERSGTTESTPAAAKRPYLPMGLRQRLADHFCLSLHAIDKRIRKGDSETCRVAKQMIMDDAEARLGSILHKHLVNHQDKYTQSIKRKFDELITVSQQLNVQLNLFDQLPTTEPTDATPHA